MSLFHDKVQFILRAISRYNNEKRKYVSAREQEAPAVGCKY